MNLSARFELVIVHSKYCFTVTKDDECVLYGHWCREEASYLYTLTGPGAFLLQKNPCQLCFFPSSSIPPAFSVLLVTQGHFRKLSSPPTTDPRAVRRGGPHPVQRTEVELGSTFTPPSSCTPCPHEAVSPPSVIEEADSGGHAGD
jgi:hypothetical protein